MQNSIKKRGAMISALVVAAFLVVYLAVLLFAVVRDASGEIVGLIILGLYGLIIAAVVAGVMIALRQRLKEIDTGEEDEAKKY